MEKLVKRIVIAVCIIFVLFFLIEVGIEKNKNEVITKYTQYNVSDELRKSKEIQDILLTHNAHMDHYRVTRTVEYAALADRSAVVVMSYPYEATSYSYNGKEYSYDAGFLRDEIINSHGDVFIDDHPEEIPMWNSTWDSDRAYFEPYVSDVNTDSLKMVRAAPICRHDPTEYNDSEDAEIIYPGSISEYVFDDAQSKRIYVFILEQW